MKIPLITDQELKELLPKIKPVVRAFDKFYTIQDPHPRRESFVWKPTLVSEIKDLILVETIKSIHSCGHPLLFKPSVAEVIACIPPELRQVVRFFEVSMDAVETIGSQFHVAKTHLYK